MVVYKFFAAYTKKHLSFNNKRLCHDEIYLKEYARRKRNKSCHLTYFTKKEEKTNKELVTCHFSKIVLLV